MCVHQVSNFFTWNCWNYKGDALENPYKDIWEVHPSWFFDTPASILTLGFHFPRNRLSWDRRKQAWPEGALELFLLGGEATPRTLKPTWISFCSWVPSREQVGTALVKEVLYDWQATPIVCRGVPQLGVFSQYCQWTHFLLSCSFKSNYVHTIAIQSVFVYSFSIILNLRWLCTPIVIPST